MPEIPLKQKYRVGGTSRYKSPGGNTGGKRRQRTKNKAADEQALRVRVMSATGKSRMMRAEDV